MRRTHVYLWPIHVDVWQKPSHYCKVITCQLKKSHNCSRIMKGRGVCVCVYAHTCMLVSTCVCMYRYAPES